MESRLVSRRRFCQAALALLVAPAVPVWARVQPDRRVLRLRNTHTDEDLDIAYFARGEYVGSAVRELNRFLRCPHTGQVADIDLGVVDQLWRVTRSVGADARIQVISGYRSPTYNEYLRRQGRHVAKNSLHIQGLAIDFAVPGVSNRRLASLARSLRAGGVGTYPDFVHIDTGPVRSW